MDAAREAAAARDAAALQRQRDRNIKKRDEERVKRLASEKAKKTRLAAERRVRSCCSCVLVPNDSAPNSKPVLARQAREQAVLESQASSDRNREETLRRLGERLAPAAPRCDAVPQCSRPHLACAAEKRNGRIQQKEAARARRGSTESEHAAPEAQCALRPRLARTQASGHAPLRSHFPRSLTQVRQV